MQGTDHAVGAEPVVQRILSDKDEALAAARAAGLAVLEGRYRVDKYRGDSTDPADLYESIELAPNLFLTAGIAELWKLVAGQTATAFNGSNARLCVGDSTAAAAAAQTDLQGTNKYRQLVDSAPVVSNNQITFVATFGTGVANYAWQEVGVASAASAGTMLSRTVASLGTKTSSATWTLTWTLSIS